MRGLRRHWGAIFNKLDATLKNHLRHDSDYTEETVEGLIVSIDNLSHPYVSATTASSTKLSALSSSTSSEPGQQQKNKKKRDFKKRNENKPDNEKKHKNSPFKKKNKPEKSTLASTSSAADTPAKENAKGKDIEELD